MSLSHLCDHEEISEVGFLADDEVLHHLVVGLGGPIPLKRPSVVVVVYYVNIVGNVGTA